MSNAALKSKRINSATRCEFIFKRISLATLTNTVSVLCGVDDVEIAIAINRNKHPLGFVLIYSRYHGKSLQGAFISDHV